MRIRLLVPVFATALATSVGAVTASEVAPRPDTILQGPARISVGGPFAEAAEVATVRHGPVALTEAEMDTIYGGSFRNLSRLCFGCTIGRAVGKVVGKAASAVVGAVLN